MPGFGIAGIHHTRIVYCCFLCQENTRCDIKWPSRFDLYKDRHKKVDNPGPDPASNEGFRDQWADGSDGNLIPLYRYTQKDGKARVLILNDGTVTTVHVGPESSQNYHEVVTGYSCRKLRLCRSFQQPGDYCDSCDDNNVIYTLHDHCYQTTQHPVKIPLEDLALYAHHIRSLFPFGDVSAAERDMKFKPSRDLLLNPSPRTSHLGDTLHRISMLPQELIDVIMVELEGTMTLACLKARRAMRHLLPKLKSLELRDVLEQPTWSHCWRGRPVGGPYALYASTTKILGQSYITGLGLNDDRIFVSRRKYQLSIPILKKPIYGLECSLSSLGVTAVRILYTDYTESAWLGHWSISDAWRTVVYGPDLTALRVLSDGLRVMRVDFDAQHGTQAQYNRTQSTLINDNRVLSVRPMLLSTQTWFNHYEDAAYWRATTPDVARALGYPGCRLCETVSFVDCSGQYMSGLTVHFSEPGIQGIQAHFRSDAGSNMMGSTGAYRIHFALCKKEYLTSAWLYQGPPDPKSHFVGGSTILAFTTSRGRTQIFTSEATRIAALNTDSSYWTCLTSKAHTKVTGLMVDVFGPGERYAYSDFGVTEQKNFTDPVNLADGPYYPELESARSLLPPAGTHPAAVGERRRMKKGYYYMNSASLDNVARIIVQQDKGDKLLLLGMQIIHHDGVIDTFGRFWHDEKHDGKITREVYKAEDGELKEIRLIAPNKWVYNDVVAEVADPMDFVDSVMFTTHGANGSGVDVIFDPVHPGMRVCWRFGDTVSRHAKDGRVWFENLLVYTPAPRQILGDLLVRRKDLELLM